MHITFQIRRIDDAYMVPSRLTLLQSDFAKQIALACNVDIQAVVDTAGENASVSIAHNGLVSAYVLGETAPINQLALTLYGLPFQSRLLEAVSAVAPDASATSVSFGDISVQPEQFVPVVPTTTSTSTLSTTTTTSTTSSVESGISAASSHSTKWWWVLAIGAFLVLACGLTCAILAVRARRAVDRGETQMQPQSEAGVPQPTGPVLLGGQAIAQSSEHKESKTSPAKPGDVMDAALESSRDVQILQNLFSTPPRSHERLGDLEHGRTSQDVDVNASVRLTTPRTEGDCNLAACSAKCW